MILNNLLSFSFSSSNQPDLNKMLPTYPLSTLSSLGILFSYYTSQWTDAHTKKQ